MKTKPLTLEERANLANTAKAAHLASHGVANWPEDIVRLCSDLDRVEDELRFYKEREQHFAKVLGVADGGQYRNDWDAPLKDAVNEARRLRELHATVRGEVESWLGSLGPDSIGLCRVLTSVLKTLSQEPGVGRKEVEERDQWLAELKTELNRAVEYLYEMEAQPPPLGGARAGALGDRLSRLGRRIA